MNSNIVIEGAGGGKGGGSSSSPTEAPNTLRSNAKIKSVEIVSSGKIKQIGDDPLNPEKGVYLNKTPIMAADGTYNVSGVRVETRLGEPDQAHLAGFPSAENTITVGTELKYNVGIVRRISDVTLDAVAPTIQIPAMTIQDTETGDLNGHSVTVEWYIKADADNPSSDFALVARDRITGKTTSAYQRQYYFSLPGTGPWDIKAVRKSVDETKTTRQNKTFFDTYTEISEHKLSYPNTAIVGIELDAEKFGNQIPTRAFDVWGIEHPIPSNYNPYTNIYTGEWDGTFVTDWSCSPPWILFNLLTNDLYGLGDLFDETEINKWDLYLLARYCDAVDARPQNTENNYGPNGRHGVPDGKGGFEPRFKFNGVINTEESALKVLQSIAGMMRAAMLWTGEQLGFIQNKLQSATRPFTPANVVNGAFNYSGTALTARHTIVHVTWFDPNQFYERDVVIIEDEEGVLKYGAHVLKITAYGCTSESQAYRHGLNALLTEKLETDTVSFKVGFQNATMKPGEVIKIFDPMYTQNSMGGRLLSADASVVELDREVTFLSGETYTLYFVSPAGVLEEVLVDMSVMDGQTTDTVTLLSAIPQDKIPLEAAMWGLSYEEVEPREFRVLVVNEEKKTAQFKVTAVQYSPQKFAAIDNGTKVVSEDDSFSDLPDPSIVIPPSSPKISYTTNNGTVEQRGMIVTSWIPPNDPYVDGYQVRYKFGDKNWSPPIITDSPSYDFEAESVSVVYVEIRSRSRFGKLSTPIGVGLDLTTGTVDGQTLVYNLQLQSGGTEWSGKPILIEWSARSAYGPEEGDTNGKDQFFKRFRIRVRPEPANGNDATFYAMDPRATIPYETLVSLGLSRSYHVQVDIEGKDGTFSLPAVQVFTNPPPALGPLTFNVTLGGVSFTPVPPDDPDYAGVLLWTSTTDQVDVTPGQETFRGPGNYFAPLFATDTLFFRYAYYDAFSTDQLNVSAVQEVTPHFFNPQHLQENLDELAGDVEDLNTAVTQARADVDAAAQQADLDLIAFDINSRVDELLSSIHAESVNLIFDPELSEWSQGNRTSDPTVKSNGLTTGNEIVDGVWTADGSEETLFSRKTSQVTPGNPRVYRITGKVRIDRPSTTPGQDNLLLLNYWLDKDYQDPDGSEAATLHTITPNADQSWTPFEYTLVAGPEAMEGADDYAGSSAAYNEDLIRHLRWALQLNHNNGDGEMSVEDINVKDVTEAFTGIQEVKTAIVDETEARTTETGAIIESVNALSIRTGDAESAIVNLDTVKADQADLTTEVERINVLTSTVGDNTSDITDLSITKADGADLNTETLRINALTSRTEDAESEISTLQSTKADQSDLTTEANRITTIQSQVDGIVDTDLPALNSSITTLEQTKADQTDLTTEATRITNLETQIEGQPGSTYPKEVHDNRDKFTHSVNSDPATPVLLSETTFVSVTDDTEFGTCVETDGLSLLATTEMWPIEDNPPLRILARQVVDNGSGTNTIDAYARYFDDANDYKGARSIGDFSTDLTVSDGVLDETISWSHSNIPADSTRFRFYVFLRAMNGGIMRTKELEVVLPASGGLQSQITDLQNTKANQEDLDTEATRINSLTSSVGQAQSDISNLETTKADQADLNTEATRITNLSSTVGDNTSDISTLQTTKANQSDLSTEAGRITALDSRVGVTESGISSLETTKANQTDLEAEANKIVALNSRVGTNESDILNSQQTIATNQQATAASLQELSATLDSVAGGTKTENELFSDWPDPNGMPTSWTKFGGINVTRQAGDLGDYSARTTIGTGVFGGISQTVLDLSPVAYTARIRLKGVSSNLGDCAVWVRLRDASNNNLQTVQWVLQDHPDIAGVTSNVAPNGQWREWHLPVDATAFADVDNALFRYYGHLDADPSRPANNIDIDFFKLGQASLPELQASVATLSSASATQAGDIDSLTTYLGAYNAVRVTAGGELAEVALRSTNDGTVSLSEIKLSADRLIYSADGQVVWYSDADGLTMNKAIRWVAGVNPSNPDTMYVLGLGFGANNDLMEWFGPFSATVDGCTKTNGTRAKTIDGKTYLEGTQEGGTAINSSSSTNAGASAEVTSIGANGNTTEGTMSYLRTGVRSYQTANNDPSGTFTQGNATVELSRRESGTAYPPPVYSVSVTGTLTRTNEGYDPELQAYIISEQFAMSATHVHEQQSNAALTYDWKTTLTGETGLPTGAGWSFGRTVSVSVFEP